MKSSLNRAVVALAFAASLFAGALAPTLGQQGHNPFTPSPAPESGPWMIASEQSLAVEGELVALSPDGQWIAGIGPEGNQFCVWNVETLDPTCDEKQEPVYPESITWAPDSSAVAYSLNALVYLFDSDIFVFEVAAGESVNLTDDGFADSIPLGDTPGLDTLPIDIVPAWTPDSLSLIFARTEWIAEQPTTELMMIAREGGEPEQLHTVRDDFPWAISSPIFVLKDGSILYSQWVGDSEDPGNGIWLVAPDGEAIQLVPGSSDESFALPAITDVRETGNGTIASGYSRQLAADATEEEVISFVLDVETGEYEPVQIDAGGSGYMSPYSYSPDGTSTISLENRDGERRVVITGSDGDVLDLGEHEGGRQINSRGLDWADNDTILIPDFANGGTLVSVERGVETPPCGCIDPAEG